MRTNSHTFNSSYTNRKDWCKFSFASESGCNPNTKRDKANYKHSPALESITGTTNPKNSAFVNSQGGLNE